MKNDNIGIDGVELTFELDKENLRRLSDRYNLLNEQGRIFGSVEVLRRKVNVKFNSPKYVRENNLIPFSRNDFIKLNSMWLCLERQLSALFGDLSKCRLKNIECNITLKIVGRCALSQVLDLINRSFTDTVNIVYEGVSAKCKYMKKKQSLIIKVKNYFILKIYNKTLEATRKEIPVEQGLLRIEIVMLDRTIKRLFSGRVPNLREVLCQKLLRLFINEYKRIFSEVIVKKHITPCLNGIVKILHESLHETGNLIDTIALLREIIVDQEVYRRALYKWYLDRGFTHLRATRNADNQIFRLKKYGLPQDVIATIKAFNQLCK